MSSSASKAKPPRWIDYQPISDVKGAERNPKQHSPELGSAIDRFGFADGVILDERTGRLVAGHGRLERLKLMQEEGQDAPDGVRVIKGKWLLPVQRGWSSRSDKEAEAFLVAHNRLTEQGGWDDRALFELLEQFEGDDLAGLGVDETYLGELQERVDELNEEGLPEGEDTGGGEPPADPVSKRGEVYALGPHRLMCGDSTSAEDVAALLGEDEPNLMVTDPPYGVEYDPEWCQRAGVNDGGRLGVVENDDRADWSEAWALFPGSVAYVWHAGCKSPDVAKSLEGFDLRGLICWAKPRFAISRGHYHHQHEPCWYAVRKGKTASWAGDRSQTTLWAIGLDKNLEGDVKHSTQKPVECMERPIRNHEGDVYDPFLGSGTTLIAAARTGRKCYGMEISPAYCDVIRKRWGDWARSADVDPGPDAL